MILRPNNLRWPTAVIAIGLIQQSAAIAQATDAAAAAMHFPVGVAATYRLVNAQTPAASTVQSFILSSGLPDDAQSPDQLWINLSATKVSGDRFAIWILGDGFPAAKLPEAQAEIARYIVQEGNDGPLEFRHQTTGRAVLPVLGGWEHLLPRAASTTVDQGIPKETALLGHRYQLAAVEQSEGVLTPPSAKVIELRAEALVGFPHNTKQKDQTRRYDLSDYELIRLTKTDYLDMVAAGINCVNVDAEQAAWVRDLNIFFWGVGGDDERYPECLYRSNYLGPSLFMDEPAVVTRDHIIRPKLRSSPEFREAITPQTVVEDFRHHFYEAKNQGAPTHLLARLAAREDVDLGEMQFLQQNIYSWETMISSAIHQLSEDRDGPPAAIVFEPPGRFGTRRTLPEMNMTYGCQIPVDDPKNLSGIIYGFLRGAARVTGKNWGMSIYGAVDRADTFWLQTHAYDLGATHFFYWDSFELACVPYRECLAMSRNLSDHALSHPDRDLVKLKHAAEVAILLPVGYNLGHVAMGKGSLWALNELNLERRNAHGVSYRTVMGNFFTEIERCIRHGVAYDLFWDVENMELSGYREVIRVREDGKVQVQVGGKVELLGGPRPPTRPRGAAPQMTVAVAADGPGAPASITATAHLVEGSAPVYYTLGADHQGRYRNVMVAWELYGPQEEDYRFLREEGDQPRIQHSESAMHLEIDFRIDVPGEYRLRAATVDLSGRTSVVWKSISVE